MAAYEESGKSNEGYTPKYIFDALGVTFDLDVAAPIEGPRYVPARRWFWERALERDWDGFVWMNFPFGHQKHKMEWLEKFFDHGNGIALAPDRTSAPWYQKFSPKADLICFVDGKIKFERPDGTVPPHPGTGTVLFAAGDQAVSTLAQSGLGVMNINYDRENLI